jgi:hypothetical protein
MYDVITSPNVLMYIESGKSRISCVSITDQRFHENLVHDGNIYPPKTKTLNDILESARRLTKWLQSEGYTGIVGFDFCEYFEPKRGRIEHFLSDINPRINGAAYPKALMEHLNTLQAQENRPKVEAFLSANVKTGLKSFAELSKHYGHLFYKPENGRGLMPYTIGCLENGKFSVAVFGKSREEVMETYGALEKLTPGLCPS